MKRRSRNHNDTPSRADELEAALRAVPIRRKGGDLSHQEAAILRRIALDAAQLMKRWNT